MSRYAARFLSAVLALSSITFSSLAQHPSTEDTQLREMEQYTLTMDNVNRYVATMQDLKPVLDARPELQDAMLIDSGNHEPFDHVVARISASPELVSVMANHGFTPRQFLLEETVLMQASLGVQMKPPADSDAAYGQRTHINPANLAFVREHQAELRALKTRRHQAR